jgi:NAD(P)-dependent dehydrogenase (short-subunit alcohol dehydrogenase family)
MDKSQLTKKAALVTGGGSGIGRACAMVLAQKGAAVLVSDINLDAAQSVADEIVAAGGKAVANQCNVSDITAVEAMVKAAITAFGQLDIAVNNAGILGNELSIDEYDHESWNSIMSVNLNGVFLCVQAQLKHFYANSGGAIVNMASEAALKGGTADAAYTASKHAVAGFTKAAALEAVQRGVRINAVCPGAIETPLTKAIMEAHPERAAMAAGMMPIGRLGQPEEIAEAVAWLCSDSASLVAGHMLAVDGAWAAS